MAYQNNIPTGSQRLKDSQQDLLDNFAAIQTLVAVNHGTFGAADEGKHKWVAFPLQGSAPSFSAGEEGLYNQLFATTSKNELYVHKQTNAGTADIPYTASILSTVTAPAAGSAGWTYLPSGIILRWEQVASATGLTTVTLSGVTFPTFTQIITVFVTPFSTSTSDVDFAVRFVDVLSTTQFRVYVSSRTSTGSGTGGFKMFIIGY